MSSTSAEPGERPANVVALDDVEEDEDGDRMVAEAAARSSRGSSGRGAGPDAELAIPHCHSAEEEVFVVLEGDGTLELWPSPRLARAGAERETHAIRAGDVIARPPGTRVSHFIKAGANGMTCLVYGTREPNDICLLPALEQDRLSRRRSPRPHRVARLLGRRAALSSTAFDRSPILDQDPSTRNFHRGSHELEVDRRARRALCLAAIAVAGGATAAQGRRASPQARPSATSRRTTRTRPAGGREARFALQWHTGP